MRKTTIIVFIILTSISVFLLGFNYKNSEEPNSFYRVYLDQEIIGVIKSKQALEKYINERGDYIKQKYGITEVYAPNGLEIKKILTYNGNVDNVKQIYTLIEKAKPFTISGFQLTIKGNKVTNKVYVTEEQVFRDAVTQTVKTFVGTDSYNSFISNTQSPIETTGRIIESTYVQEDITIKAMHVPVTETIYNNPKELSKYLLFGTTEQQRKYQVKLGETIDQVAFDNKISVEEFLISNPSFTNSKNLLFPGQEVIIGVTNPQIKVVEKEHVVEDIVSKFGVEYVVDPALYKNQEKIVRAGENGLTRITQQITTINGEIAIVSDPEKKQEIKAAINKIIHIGNKETPHYVGNTDSWGWPTNSGWTISSGYGYRINPINGARELHDAIDIAGTGFGSNIYATNAGTVIVSKYNSVNGNYIEIDHNNGYFSLYAHLSKNIVKVGDVVIRGQVIGYMGRTGWATGNHLHFAIYNRVPFTGGYALNTLSFFR